MSEWAHDFYEIPESVDGNEELRDTIINLLENDPIPGKVTEGGDRIEALRGILNAVFNGNLDIWEAISQVSSELPRRESPHSANNQVFPSGWEERLIRTQISRFYNQAVLLTLVDRGHQKCFVPHSPNEDPDTPCTLNLAGQTANVGILLERLERKYRDGQWHDEITIPDHPHCTHAIVPA